ncbi:MAG: elongation factor Ts [Candidatus Komeilibacteria bacterium]|nr:elongation factor Ts [Candidatus Komeilibacteria bacterium]
MDMELLKKLRQATGAGVNDVSKALAEVGDDYDKALDWLRQHGQKVAGKKQDREIKEGLIESYIHQGGKTGVLLEVGCETDFVARNDDFKNFVHEVALQIAATDPQYVSPADVPAEVVEKERAIYAEEVAKENKPAEIQDKIITGKLEKFYSQVCLLKQTYIKDDSLTIEKLLNNTIAKVGENIRISRFTRYSL